MKKLITIIIVVCFAVNSAGQGYALRPMAIKNSQKNGESGIKGFRGGEEKYWTRYPVDLIAELKDYRLDNNDKIVIVDLGCATGTITRWISRHVDRSIVLGIDKDRKSIKIADEKTASFGMQMVNEQGGLFDLNDLREARESSVGFIAADLFEGLLFDAHSIDAFIMHRLRDSIKKPEAREVLNKRLAVLLKPGGYVSLAEDLYVAPSDFQGEWYASRYKICKNIIGQLIENGFLPRFYFELLSNPNYHLILSLRTQSGEKIDETIFLENEQELIKQIESGEIEIRGVGVHEREEHVIDSFRKLGFFVLGKKQIVMKDTGARQNRYIIMKSILFQKLPVKKTKAAYIDGHFTDYFDSAA